MNKNTSVKIFSITILCFIIVSAVVYAILVATNPPVTDNEVIPSTTVESTVTTEALLIDEPILYYDAGYKTPITKNEAIDCQNTLATYITELEMAIDSGEYTETAIGDMLEEISRLEIDIELLQTDICKFTKWEEEYPNATKVWYFLREKGISEEVSAGIIGNMMIETSGGTLALKPTIYSPGKSFYGLCQWKLKYRPHVAGMSLEEQLNYLCEDMPLEFDEYGFCYRKKFTYQDFLELDSVEAAAKAFFKVYERGSGSYVPRQRAAKVAYNYFVAD